MDYDKSAIDEVFKKIWEYLKIGLKDRDSDYHTFSFASSHKNIVKNRTVVLRDYNEVNKTISFHTNNLTEKVLDINNNKNVEALFYNKKEKIQIRISGLATVNKQDDLCEKKWLEMSDQSKECYFQNINPGKSITNPNLVTSIIQNEVSKYFTIITIHINKIDWLYLSSKGHKRIKFISQDNFKGEWIAP
jgi:general stress protein 26